MDNESRMTSAEWLQCELLKASLAAAEQSGMFVKWVLTGSAAMIGLIVSNAGNALHLIDKTCLALGVSLLTVSLVLGFVAVVAANMVNAGTVTQARLQTALTSPVWLAKVRTSGFDNDAMKVGMANAYWWPLRQVTRHAMKHADGSPLYGFLFLAKVLSVHTGAAWLQSICAFFGIAAMAVGVWI